MGIAARRHAGLPMHQREIGRLNGTRGRLPTSEGAHNLRAILPSPNQNYVFYWYFYYRLWR